MNGVKVRFFNRKEILPRLLVLAQGLLASRANVMEVSLFGSLAWRKYYETYKFLIFFLNFFANTAIPISPEPRRNIIAGSEKVISLPCPINGAAEIKSFNRVENGYNNKTETKQKEIKNMYIFFLIKNLIPISY